MCWRCDGRSLSLVFARADGIINKALDRIRGSVGRENKAAALAEANLSGFFFLVSPYLARAEKENGGKYAYNDDDTLYFD